MLIDHAILDAIAVEAEDQFQAIEAGLLDLEKNPGDRRILDAVFRAVHTLKGSASFAEMDRTARLAHTMETVLSGFREGAAELTDDKITRLLRSVDALRQAQAKEMAECRRRVDEGD